MSIPTLRAIRPAFLVVAFAPLAFFGALYSAARAEPVAEQSAANSAAAQKSAAPIPSLVWLTPTEANALVDSVPPKPPQGSDADIGDLKKAIEAQTSRTDVDIAIAKKYKKDYGLIVEVIGPGFDKQNYPITYRLLHNVTLDTSIITGKAKARYARNRPFVDHAEIKNLFPVDGYSYPSGHSSGSRVIAVILGKLFPDKAQALLSCSDAIARSRVIAGVHYTTDIEAGKALGQAVADALLKNPSFQVDLKAAMDEVSAQPHH